ncbi:MAG: putative ABC transporter permease [Nanoarchaeota archaeon]
MIIQEMILVFLIGSFFGWIFETIRTGIINKQFTNRGFLKGIYLPIYGFGAVIVLLISYLDINLFYRILLFLISITLLEFVIGIIFLKNGIKLWDYNWSYNYKGLVSIYSSFLWLILALIFYFFIFPDIKIISEVLFKYNIMKVFILLIYFTIFIDFVTRIKKLFS